MAYEYWKEASYTNELGQVINIGDQVVVVASGRNNKVGIRKGMYLGRKGKSVTVQVVTKVNRWVDGKMAEVVGTRRGTFPSGRIFPYKG